MRLLAALSTVAVATAAIHGYTRTETYHGEQVLTCRLNEATAGKAFDHLSTAHDLDVWGSSKAGSLDIRVVNQAAAEAVQAHFNNECDVAIADLESHVRAMDEQWEAEVANQPVNVSYGDPTWFNNYRRYEELVNWYRDWASANSDLVRYIPSIGSSAQNRVQPAVVITSRNAPANAPRFYVQCLIHAREWISGATCNWVANQLVEDYKNGDEVARYVLDNSQLHLVPFTNPDGYAWSWSNARLWRKSRNTNQGSTCLGTDLNRNYDDHWGEGGSSPNPCADTYMGSAAASEPETRNTVAYFRSIAPVIGAVDNHAYSQLLLRPYGWTRNDSPDEPRLRAIGAGMQAAIQATHGRNYRNIKSIELYITTGTTSDWFYGAATRTNQGFRAAGYTFELRPTGALPGFQLPPSEIVPNSREIYNAFRFFFESLIDEPIRDRSTA